MDLMKIRGAYRLKQTLARVNTPGLVLMYHRVAHVARDPWNIVVSPEHFAAHMAVLKRHAVPVKVSALAARTGRLNLGRKYAAVTFDDGYADNAVNARPILEREGVPATFFIVSGAIDSREEFWWDELDRIILEPAAVPAVCRIALGSKSYSWNVTASRTRGPVELCREDVPVPPQDAVLSRMDLYYLLWRLLSDLSYQQKKAALRDLAAWANVPAGARADYRAMTTTELKDLAASPLFEIGAHTVRHPMLSKLAPKDQEAEAAYSREDLQKVIGRAITSFAYPHGMFTPETVGILKRLRFDAACTVEQRLVKRGEDTLRLPRFAVEDWSGEEFERRLNTWLRSL